MGVHHHITSAMVIEIKIADLDQLDLSNSLLVQHITNNQFNGKLMLQRTTRRSHLQLCSRLQVQGFEVNLCFYTDPETG